ncbi:MAG: TolC family protein, partial [Candidatus Hydrogenedentes bacterium]|nr:TolC family protein [Candidatus Hydrogenedentota bacterium]
KDMEDIVSARYGVGISEEADVLRVQIEQSELEDQYNQFLQQRPVFSARLASALGRETAEDLPWPQPAPAQPSPPPVPLVMAWLRTQNPLLQESEALIEGRRHEIELAKKQGRPNITVGLEFQDMKSMTMPPQWPYMLGVDTARGIVSGDAAMIAAARSDAISESIAEIYMSERNRARDEVMLTVGFSLPVWRKRVRASVEEARQMEQAAVADKRDRMLELDVEARMALFDMQDGARRFNLYRDVLLPRAQQTYDSLQGRYASGDTTAGFLDVLGSVQALLNTELEQVRALRDIQIGGARLERVLGGPWTEQAEAESSPSPITIVEK